ncbi:MAG: transporter substrate-binding domain-containing protein [Desulfobacterales bacterium]|nr:transporter substrate-binding domain-containing protein [Desulfobacterales bacterium]
MRRNIFIIIAFIIALNISAEARTLEEIKRTKEIRFCVTAYAFYTVIEPKECRENCKVTGPIYEEIIAFVKTLGEDITPKFIHVEWDEQFHNKDGKTILDDSYTPELLNSGKCDCYPNNLTKNDWRLKKLDFAILFPSRMMVIVNNANKKNFKTISDLQGKSVSIVENSAQHTWIIEQNKFKFSKKTVKIKLIREEIESINSIINGEVDFTLIDSDLAIGFAKRYPKDIAVAFSVTPIDEIGWAFRKEDKDLISAVQFFFDEQINNDASVYNNIWQNHFGISLKKFIRLIKSTN